MASQDGTCRPVVGLEVQYCHSCPQESPSGFLDGFSGSSRRPTREGLSRTRVAEEIAIVRERDRTFEKAIAVRLVLISLDMWSGNPLGVEGLAFWSLSAYRRLVDIGLITRMLRRLTIGRLMCIFKASRRRRAPLTF